MAGRSSVYLPSAEPRALVRAVEAAAADSEDMVAVMLAEAGAPPLDEVVTALSATKVPFFGGLFPALIDGQHRRDTGALLVALPRLAEPMVVRGLDGGRFSLPDVLPFVQWHRGSKPTALLLVDGLAPNISHFLRAVYHQLGNRVCYWGGGAGSLSLQPRPCLFTREGIHQGAAILALSSLPSRLGMRHGWRELKGPFVATRSDRNAIIQLNWRNAFDVYRSTVEADAGVTITPENFFRIANGYPFGIRKEGQEVLVRDPVAVGAGGSLLCVGEVPENAALFILKGEPRLLVSAAGQAAREALLEGASAVSQPIRHCLVADCVSRSLFLGERFSDELNEIADALGGGGEGRHPMGMLTLGEISSHGEGYLEFLNKTSVVAVVHEP
jgi:hypothetical protein